MRTQQNGIIYKAVNIHNNKVYIGKTLCFEQRKAEHLSTSLSTPFSKALVEYGQDSFAFSIVDQIDIPYLSILESSYINIYNSSDCMYGYNISHPHHTIVFHRHNFLTTQESIEIQEHIGEIVKIALAYKVTPECVRRLKADHTINNMELISYYLRNFPQVINKLIHID